MRICSILDIIHLGMHARVLRSLKLSEWTECQLKTFSVFPIKNVMLESFTGSGKTLAYLVPLLESMTGKERQMGVVVVPTRELARQVGTVASDLISKSFSSREVQSTYICAGASIGAVDPEKSSLLVATPGALLNNLTQINPNQVKYIVIDEVDRLLDFGFISQLEQILGRLTSGGNRPSILVASATFPKEVDILCSRILGRDFERIKSQTSHPPGLVNEVLVYEPRNFLPALGEVVMDALDRNLLQQGLVVFPTTRSLMLFYSRFKTGFHQAGLLERLTVHALHGRMLDEKRKNISDKFHSFQSPQLLLATDVAARGLDFPNLSLVCQVGLSGVEDPVSQFIHRSGRTARAGNEGRNILLLGNGLDDNSKWLREIRAQTALKPLEFNSSPPCDFLHEVTPYQRHLSTKGLESLLSWFVERRGMLGLKGDREWSPMVRDLESKANLVKRVVDLVRSSGVPEPRIASKLAKKLRIDDIPGILLDSHR